MKFLEKYQQKSESKRKMYAFGVSGIVTLLVFAVWATAFLPGIDGKNVRTTSLVTPFKSLRQDLANAYASLEQSLGGVKEKINTISSKEYESKAVNTYTATTTLDSETEE